MTKKMTTIDFNLAYKAEECLSKLGHISKISNRLQAIVASYKHGAKKVCEVLDISRSTLHRWILRFEKHGMDGLKDVSKPSRSKLDQQQQEQLKEWVETNPVTTLKELVIRIKEEMGVTIDKSSVHRVLSHLGFSHITGRKQHYKADVARQEEFKKKLKSLAASTQQLVYFFDESRFGTHTKTGYAWFKKGTRTRIKSKLGFQSFYLYSAVCGITGESFSLIASSVDKVCMQIFLDEFAKTLKDNVILVMDNAGWHNGLNVPGNISILYLPPYSPELNPAERFWEYIKDHILKNKFYDDLQHLEDVLCAFLKRISSDIVSSVCRCSYVLL